MMHTKNEVNVEELTPDENGVRLAWTYQRTEMLGKLLLTLGVDTTCCRCVDCCMCLYNEHY
jgi:hypothetical protein